MCLLESSIFFHVCIISSFFDFAFGNRGQYRAGGRDLVAAERQVSYCTHFVGGPILCKVPVPCVVFFPQHTHSCLLRLVHSSSCKASVCIGLRSHATY